MSKPIRIPNTAKGKAEFKRWERLALETDPEKKNMLLLTELRLIHKNIAEIKGRLNTIWAWFMKSQSYHGHSGGDKEG